MHRPVFHESALAAFFRRHGLTAPYIDADGLIERHGLVLAMAFGLRAGGFRVDVQPDGTRRIGAETFTETEYLGTLHDAHEAAHKMEAIHDGTAPDLRGDMVDRMALIAVRLASAGIPVTAQTLRFEGIPAGIVDQHALEAAQIAEAMKLAITRWRNAARKRTEAAATRELVAA
jgi:hypothetical protein